jgi:hypothetical protein
MSRPDPPPKTPTDVSRALTTAQPLTIDEARPLGVIPASAGFYAWWQMPGAIPSVPASAHPSGDLELLYVGIAPRDAASSATLASRLRSQHIGGNIGSSTCAERDLIGVLVSGHCSRRCSPAAGDQDRERRESGRSRSLI